MSNSIYRNRKVLITAGPTREAIDPVRYISNHSSGKMGFAIAKEFLLQGADVILITGPVNIEIEHPRLKMTRVNTAAEMYLACCRYFEEVDIAVFAAAVADYRPEKIALHKIKKQEDEFMIRMTRNIDIACEFGKIKTVRQISVGFALETNDEIKNAIGKLNKKNFDLVVLNSMNDKESTFGYDTNKISIIKNDLSIKEFPFQSKTAAAHDIVKELSGLLLAQQGFPGILQVA